MYITAFVAVHMCAPLSTGDQPSATSRQLAHLLTSLLLPRLPQAFTDLATALGTTTAALLTNRVLLTSVLRYHVLSVVLPNTTALAGAGTQATLSPGKSVALSGT